MDTDRKALRAMAHIHKTLAATASEFGCREYAGECQDKADAEVWQLTNHVW